MNLRDHRLAAGLTQARVAHSLGVTRTYYASVECHALSISARVADDIRKLYGWCIEDIRIAATRASNGRRAKQAPPTVTTTANPCLHITDQAWTLYMMALVAYDGEVPQDWRNTRRHSDLARSAMYAAVGRMTAKGRMLHA